MCDTNDQLTRSVADKPNAIGAVVESIAWTTALDALTGTLMKLAPTSRFQAVTAAALLLLSLGLGALAVPALGQSSARPVALGDAGTAGAARGKIRLTRKSPTYWRVTLANPPLNIIGPPEVRGLVGILEQIEQDPRVQVVVFDSAVPGYFSAHYDLLTPLADSTGMPPGPTGMHPVPDFMVRLGRLPVVSIVSIRGRATGIGSELALAADMRFASREKAVLSQFEVGAGFVPGGGPMARLPRLVGRGRAIEILLGSDDIDGELAERYGYVNRALPDAELDAFVDHLATRIASFDHQAIADTKKLIDLANNPPDSEMQPGWDAFIASVTRPAAQARLRWLLGKGLQKPGDVEEHLGRYTAAYPR